MSSRLPFPCRFGTTSYIKPDEIIPNVEYLKDRVDDIELVLFESDEFSNLPSPDDIRRLSELAAEHELTYSVHLPLDAYLGHADRDERERSVEKCQRIVELTESLPRSAYVVHAEAGKGVDLRDCDASKVSRFQDAFRSSAARLIASSDASASEFAVETLNYPYEHIWPVVDALGMSVTIDIGHLVLFGYSVEEAIDRYLSRTRVLHVHGVLDGRDHVSLCHLDASVLDLVMERLQRSGDMDRVFTMEIFSEEDFLDSCSLFERRRRRA
ncbi:cobamide remodeling phosphodiesterase CbiR [Chlorobium sp. N1]|uniref:cobamide remodeling phosphodiesterase CbiR n=1 Tax=Chlorobium sp. N1 TaxID=2491138 RepID=UPI00103CFE43|nr:cobamide remodeling phosphodiesterase CbiR [Chlorobium sp. N1]TCD47456.1 sugar phosphate isomerase/epimerase [Chlorobium sp. N1]